MQIKKRPVKLLSFFMFIVLDSLTYSALELTWYKYTFNFSYVFKLFSSNVLEPSLSLLSYGENW